jgi:leucyl/phenylalanyl-tRNA--protein transferase
LRSGAFTVTADAAFQAVIQSCAEREETWINAQIEESFALLHKLGHAHSVECWQDGELVGGLYGVTLGAAFFGESMFSRRTDASKVALAWLVARLKVGGYSLLDCQFMTEHLRSLGAVEIAQKDYLALLASAVGGAAGVALSAEGAGDAERAGRAEFGALDRLLASDPAFTVDAPASGWVIAQLLTQTS